MLHVIEIATGRIIEQCPEGSDVSRFDPASHEVISGAERVDDRDAYVYQDGQAVLKPAVAFIADKTELIADGVDQATVAVEVSGVEHLPDTIDVLLTDGAGASTHTIPLTDGQSAAYPVTATEPTTLTIRAKDQVTYNDTGGITITAVEA